MNANSISIIIILVYWLWTVGKMNNGELQTTTLERIHQLQLEYKRQLLLKSGAENMRRVDKKSRNDIDNVLKEITTKMFEIQRELQSMGVQVTDEIAGS